VAQEEIEHRSSAVKLAEPTEMFDFFLRMDTMREASSRELTPLGPRGEKQ
jgi:hypothetical protein